MSMLAVSRSNNKYIFQIEEKMVNGGDIMFVVTNIGEEEQRLPSRERREGIITDTSSRSSTESNSSEEGDGYKPSWTQGAKTRQDIGLSSIGEKRWEKGRTSKDMAFASDTDSRESTTPEEQTAPGRRGKKKRIPRVAKELSAFSGRRGGGGTKKRRKRKHKTRRKK